MYKRSLPGRVVLIIFLASLDYKKKKKKFLLIEMTQFVDSAKITGPVCTGSVPGTYLKPENQIKSSQCFISFTWTEISNMQSNLLNIIP